MDEAARIAAAPADEEADAACDAAVEAAIDEEQAADDAADAGQPREARATVLDREEAIPLSRVQCNNLGIRFQQHHEATKALRDGGIRESSGVRLQDGQYGTVLEIDGAAAVVEIRKQGNKRRRFTLPVAELTLRVPRLSQAMAKQWSIDEYVMEGPKRVRREYDDWRRRHKYAGFVSHYKRRVLGALPRHPTTFSEADFIDAAARMGLQHRTGARWLLRDFVKVTKTVTRLPKNTGPPDAPRKYRLCE